MACYLAMDICEKHTKYLLRHWFYCCVCVFRALPRNWFTCHIAPSLRLFVPNSLLVCHCSFCSKVMFHLPAKLFRFSPLFLWCSFFNCYHCSLLKAARPKQLPARVPVDPGVSPLSCVFFPNSGGKTIPRGWCSHISGSSYTKAE
jgi:hypothetical protein